jgi:hypothetical protein
MIHFTSIPYIKLDENNYVIDLVYYEAPNYSRLEIEERPEDLSCGCYQLIDGEFILDQDKYDEMYPEELDEFGNPINPASSPL